MYKKIIFIIFSLILLFSIIDVCICDNNIIWDYECDSVTGWEVLGDNVFISVTENHYVSGNSCIKIFFTESAVCGVDIVRYNISDMLLPDSALSPPYSFDRPIVGFWIRTTNTNKEFYSEIEYNYEFTHSFGFYNGYNDAYGELLLFADWTGVASFGIFDDDYNMMKDKWYKCQFGITTSSPDSYPSIIQWARNEESEEPNMDDTVGGFLHFDVYKQCCIELSSDGSNIIYLDYITLQQNFEYDIGNSLPDYNFLFLCIGIGVIIVIFSVGLYIKYNDMRRK